MELLFEYSIIYALVCTKAFYIQCCHVDEFLKSYTFGIDFYLSRAELSNIDSFRCECMIDTEQLIIILCVKYFLYISQPNKLHKLTLKPLSDQKAFARRLRGVLKFS